MVLSSALDAFVPARTGAESGSGRFDLPGISRRDRLVFALTARHLGPDGGDFAEALRALSDATEEIIPAGRVFLLGAAENRPVVGSLVSGVALTERGGSVVIVRARTDGRWTTLRELTP